MSYNTFIVKEKKEYIMFYVERKIIENGVILAVDNLLIVETKEEAQEFIDKQSEFFNCEYKIREVKNQWQENGYTGRRQYLNELANDFGVPYTRVMVLANTLGPAEDFDMLVSMLEDMASEE